jgi:2-polyprenyl-3-methyl-5-hydroxy-6-metoxy-1,4-benzoquinol methylase
MMTGSENQYHQAILDYNEANKGHPQYEFWLNYALSTNLRGKYLVDNLLRFTYSLKRKRLLDIGSGYGGTCIAAAQAGARSVGIEIDTKLLELARINWQDHPDLSTTFYQMDILDWEKVKTLGEFDVITCDNVIEHVAVPECLISHISMLLGKGSFAYITIPNAFSINQVRRDCHYGLFGISLLDPWDAAIYLEHALGQSSYDVSVYYHLEQYKSFFERYGLKIMLINSPRLEGQIGGILRLQVEELKREFEQLLGSGSVPPTIAPKLETVFDLYTIQIESSIFYYDRLPDGSAKKRLSGILERSYVEEVWYVAAFKSKNVPYPYYGLKVLNIGARKLKSVVRKLDPLLHGNK